MSDDVTEQSSELSSELQPPPPAPRVHAVRRWAPWLLCAVPLVGLAEVGLHVRQTRAVVPESNWLAARDDVKATLRDDDLVLFAPFWADPLGRQHFGAAIMTPKRAAFPDVTRFGRAFEVSIRGMHRDELVGWKKVEEHKLGDVTVGLYENPSPAKLTTDLVDLIGPDRATVARVDAKGETPCPFQRGVSQGGSTVVPQGALVPANKFVCAGGFVGVGVLHGLDHHGRLCIFASPVANATLRITFHGVLFGTSLHGHDGIQWVAERTPSAERVEISFSAFDRPIGRKVHKVGSGFGGFEFPTPDFVNKKGDLVAEITGSVAQPYYCFEGDTRE